MSKIGTCAVCGEVRKLGAAHTKCHPCLYKARKQRVQNRCSRCDKLISLHTQLGLCKSCMKRGELHHSWKGGVTNSSGYRLIRMQDHPNAQKSGYVMEHVVVMTEHLGRPLFPGENVHHRNGIRDDNRLENLELWSTHQPFGQRVVDKVAWALEVIARYGADYQDPPPGD